MVGAPGRSGRCDTCRRRKKGCDLQRPSCGTCTKAGLICAGYERQMKFINYDTKSSNSIRAQKRTARSPTVFSLPKTCEQSAFSTLLRNVFLDFYLTASFRSATASGTESDDWLRYVPDLPSSPAISSALEALGAARISMSTKDAAMRNCSVHLYSKALLETQKLVGQSAGDYSLELLATVMLLGLYEIYGYSENRCLGWTSHVNATRLLIQHMPKNDATSSLETTLSFGYRNNRIINAIGRRKSIFLENAVTANLAVGTDPVHEILQIMAQLPAYMEAADELRDNVSLFGDVKQVQCFIDQTHKLINELEAWQRERVLSTQDKLHIERASHLSFLLSISPSKAHIGKLSGNFLFPDSATAYSQILYWTALLLLYSNHWTALATFETPYKPRQAEQGVRQFEDFSPQELDVYNRAYTCARNIAKSLDHFLGPEVAGNGASLIALPITVAMGFFQYWNLPENSWCEAILIHLREVCGIPLDDFLDSCNSSKSLVLVKI